MDVDVVDGGGDGDERTQHACTGVRYTGMLSVQNLAVYRRPNEFAPVAVETGRTIPAPSPTTFKEQLFPLTRGEGETHE